jgi:hypothetical protein
MIADGRDGFQGHQKHDQEKWVSGFPSDHATIRSEPLRRATSEESTRAKASAVVPPKLIQLERTR